MEWRGQSSPKSSYTQLIYRKNPTLVDTPPAVPNALLAWWKRKISQTLARLLTRQNANISSRPIQSSKFIRSLLQPFGCSTTLASSFLLHLADTPISTVTILICVWYFHPWWLSSYFCHRSDAWDGAWSHQEHRNVHLQDCSAFWHCRRHGWMI